LYQLNKDQNKSNGRTLRSTNATREPTTTNSAQKQQQSGKNSKQQAKSKISQSHNLNLFSESGEEELSSIIFDNIEPSNVHEPGKKDSQRSSRFAQQSNESALYTLTYNRAHSPESVSSVDSRFSLTTSQAVDPNLISLNTFQVNAHNTRQTRKAVLNRDGSTETIDKIDLDHRSYHQDRVPRNLIHSNSKSIMFNSTSTQQNSNLNTSEVISDFRNKLRNPS
jgi:hypothetical protein